jgi:tRNA(Ile)-lysidine synthase
VVSVAFQGVGTKKLRLSSNEFAQIMELLAAKSGTKKLIADDNLIQKSQGFLAISLQDKLANRLTSSIKTLKIPGKTDIPKCDKWLESRIIQADSQTDLKSTPELAYLDFDKINKPIVRFRKEGDRIRPLGMRGHKLVSDIFIERKIPQFERNQIPIVISGNKIAWIAGVMIADEFKVTESTKKILNLILCEH